MAAGPSPLGGAAPAPKILLAKPPAASNRDDGGDVSSSAAAQSSRNSGQPGSLNLLSDAWEFVTDKALPFLTENTDFIVIGIIGPPGVGKSTIMNELYGYDGSSLGMLPPFAVQSDEMRATAKHCTNRLELRISSERLILIDAQPVFSPSVLVDMMRPDGSSSVPVLNGEPMPADLAHEIMGIQIGIFLASVCNVLLVVSEGINDFMMWELMQTVDLLKHNIPDPSLLSSAYSQHPSAASDKENGNGASSEGYMADLLFVHARLHGHEMSSTKLAALRNALLQFFSTSSFGANIGASSDSPISKPTNLQSRQEVVFFLPLKVPNNSSKFEFASFHSMVGLLREQVLSRSVRPFVKSISEREWMRNSSKIWDLVRRSPVVSDYCKTLQSSGMFRK